MTVTYGLLGRMGRFGNQLWQISATMVLGGDDVALPEWPYEPWFSFPPVFTGAKGEDASVLSGLPVGQREYLQEARFIHPGMRGWLEPSEPAQRILERLEGIYEPMGAAAVHVRRGDYMEAWRGHGPLPASWYRDNWPYGRVLVFSDDPDWCEVNLPGQVVREPEIESWLLLARCRQNLISNSSYAFWAAWWAGGPVTYPRPWFTELYYGEPFPDFWTPARR